VDAEDVVVLIDLVAALLALDVLVGVVLVVGIDVPSLDELGDVLSRRSSAGSS